MVISYLYQSIYKGIEIMKLNKFTVAAIALGFVSAANAAPTD
jgi:hypothetical protein